MITKALRTASGQSATYMVLLAALVPLVYPYLQAHGIIPADWSAQITTDKIVELVASTSAIVYAVGRVISAILHAVHPDHKPGEPLVDAKALLEAINTAAAPAKVDSTAPDASGANSPQTSETSQGG